MKGIIQTIRSIFEINNIYNMLIIFIGGLLAYLIVLVILCLLNRTLYLHHCKKVVKILRKFLKNRKMHKYNLIIWGLCVVFFSSIDNFRSRVGEGQEYIYIQTELASQKEINILFSQEVADDDEWKESETLLKLHVEEGFVNTEISQGMLDYYEELFSGIYKNGTKKELGKGMDLIEVKTSIVDNEYIKEANDWKSLFDTNKNSSCFYHYGRALNDAAMTINEISFMDRLEIAAYAISVEEEFLSYYDRNINDDEPVIINVENISLMNGKLYLHLAICAGAGEEEKDYANCFLVEAYKCIEQGQHQIDMQNKMYALLTYYLGNIGEKMLWKISKEDDLYMLVGKNALENYQKALKLIEDDPNFYVKEENMEINLKNGISTLNQLGFNLEREELSFDISQ